MTKYSIQEIGKILTSYYSLGTVQNATQLPRGYNNNNYRIQTTTKSFLLKVYLDKNYQDIIYETRL